MNDETKQAKNVIAKIKQLLYNYDLAIVYANGEIKLRQATMKLYSQDKRKNSQRKFIVAKIDKERFEDYIEDLENAKREIMDNLDIILSKYTPKYKQVFIMFFIENRSYDEIANETHYSFDGVCDIIAKLKKDVINMYYIAEN